MSRHDLTGAPSKARDRAAGIETETKEAMLPELIYALLGTSLPEAQSGRRCLVVDWTGHEELGASKSHEFLYRDNAISDRRA
ncbi:MAG: hypothetical protein ABSG36_10405 [Acidimicrobiales bacterium]